MSRNLSVAVHRGALLHFLRDPGDGSDPGAYEYFADGLLVIASGRVVACGPASSLLATLPDSVPVTVHRDALLVPGFVDSHVHYPQTEVIGSSGQQLLDWLADHVFPAEARFGDPAHARDVAQVCIDELLRNGTTTALVFGTVHRASVEAFFAVAAERRLRMICGKVLMDRHCPETLRDSAESGDHDSRALLERWHRRERLHYAITPRFAATSSVAQLAAAGRLAAEFPDAYIHSHLAENHAEIAWIAELFPEARSYLDVYDRFGLLRERAIYAHCIHLDETDRRRMVSTGTGAAFCPTSNLFLGSGLFNLDVGDAFGLRYALATDVGAGTSFGMLQTMAAAYQVAQLQQQRLHPLRAFYLATLGGARLLGLDDRIGSFRSGREADFLVLDLAATPLITRRTGSARTLAEQLMVLMTLGDDRAIRETFILGEPAKTRLPS